MSGRGRRRTPGAESAHDPASPRRELSGEIAGLFSGLRSYTKFVANVRISLPVIDRILWHHLDLSYDAEGRPVLRQFDFEAACQNRELRNAAWEIHDLSASSSTNRKP